LTNGHADYIASLNRPRFPNPYRLRSSVAALRS